MVDFIIELYGSIDDISYRVPNFFKSLIRFLVRLIGYILIYLRYLIPKYFTWIEPLPCVDSESDVVVSFTSFPARIDKIWIVVESLLRQKKKPKIIILWLSIDQFKSIYDLPNSVLELRDRGLDIRFRSGDLRSHKKYYYMLDDAIYRDFILVDDDIIYPSYMIEDLIYFANKFPGKVICRFAKYIIWNNENVLQPYLSWKKCNNGFVESNIFFGSGGGVLIPNESIHNNATNLNDILSCCPHADDIWLNAMCRLVSVDFVSVDEKFVLFPILNFRGINLSSINNDLGYNDIQINRVIDYCIDKFDKNPFDGVL